VTDLLELVKLAKSTGDFSALASAIPYARFLGITLEEEEGFLIGRMAYDETRIGNALLPALHGGTIGALLESTAAFQTMWDADTLIYPKIITITVDYLRSGKPVDTRARATITRRGKRVVNVGAEAWQEDRTSPIARANAHFLIQPLTDDE
jgi:acyl-coenzyme A thioesterase PaaI-like protein